MRLKFAFLGSLYSYISSFHFSGISDPEFWHLSTDEHGYEFLTIAVIAMCLILLITGIVISTVSSSAWVCDFPSFFFFFGNTLIFLLKCMSLPLES